MGTLVERAELLIAHLSRVHRRETNCPTVRIYTRNVSIFSERIKQCKRF